MQNKTALNGVTVLDFKAWMLLAFWSAVLLVWQDCWAGYRCYCWVDTHTHTRARGQADGRAHGHRQTNSDARRPSNRRGWKSKLIWLAYANGAACICDSMWSHSWEDLVVCVRADVLCTTCTMYINIWVQLLLVGSVGCMCGCCCVRCVSAAPAGLA